MDDLSLQIIKALSENIFLDIPPSCLEGVEAQMKFLNQYSQIVHEFDIPEIKESINS